jgi:hypothetical protein
MQRQLQCCNKKTRATPEPREGEVRFTRLGDAPGYSLTRLAETLGGALRLRKDSNRATFARFQMAVDFTRVFSIRLWLDLASPSILSEEGWSRWRGSRGVALADQSFTCFNAVNPRPNPTTFHHRSSPRHPSSKNHIAGSTMNGAQPRRCNYGKIPVDYGTIQKTVAGSGNI